MATDPRTASIRVLLADDHAVVRKGIRDFLLEEPDIDVVAEAADGLTAQALLRELAPEVAILDVRMPGATGIEVVQWLRAEGLPVRALMLTAFDDEPIAALALQAGAYGYMLKTADAEEIVDAVRTVAAGNSALDPLIAQKLALHLLKGAGIVSPALPFGIEPLTERERAVLVLAAAGLTNRAIGLQLDISDRTAQGHLANIYAKLQVASRTEAVTKALHLGLIDLPSSRHYAIMTRLHWRSLRVQVLLWTALPLTIFLIAISLTGIGSHQASMRALAAEETERLTNAVATGLAAQLESYQVGLEAAAGALVHHLNDPASRDALIAQTSGVMGNIDLVLFDASGAIASANGAPPAWAQEMELGAGDGAIVHAGDYILLRADLPQGAAALVAAVPVQALAFASYLGDSADLYGSTLALLDASGSPILTAGQALEGSSMASPEDEAKWRREGHCDGAAAGHGLDNCHARGVALQHGAHAAL